MTHENRTLLILGCGYLGTRLAQKAAVNGWQVDALTRNPETCAALKLHHAVRHAFPYQLNNHDWHSRLKATDYAAIAITVGSASSDPEGYRLSYLDGVKSAIEWMQDYAGPVLYTSSISVYGNADGGWLDESSPTQPENWRGSIILESENLLLDHALGRITAFRLGGIYGPDRSRFLTSMRVSQNAEEDGYLNLIHVDDAAGALIQACEDSRETVPAVLNLTDNHPVLRSEVSSKFNPDPRPSTPATISRRNPGVNRRINSQLVQKVLDWKPRYSSCLEFATSDHRPNLA